MATPRQHTPHSRVHERDSQSETWGLNTSQQHVDCSNYVVTLVGYAFHALQTRTSDGGNKPSCKYQTLIQH